MIKIIRQQTLSDFAAYNQEMIESNELFYFFLRESIMQVYKVGNVSADFFNISNGSRTIAIFAYQRNCLIYDNGFDESLAQQLAQVISAARVSGMRLSGSKHTIERILLLHGVSGKLGKARNTYRCREVSKFTKVSKGEIQMADLGRLDELSDLAMDFVREYDQSEITKEKAVMATEEAIQKKCLYQWIHRGKIACRENSILEDKVNFFFDNFHYTIVNMGHLRQFELDTPLARVNGILSQLRLNSLDKAIPYIDVHFARLTKVWDEEFWKPYVSYPSLLSLYSTYEILSLKKKKEWISASRISFPIRGGREEGYRGFSQKSNVFPGSWRVYVETKDGQIIGRIRFDVVAGSPPLPLIETTL